MATDIFKLREQGDLPIEQQDIPPDAEGQWRTDFAALHGYTPTDYDKDRWQWSLRFANQYGRGPEREDWERNYYKEQTPKEKAIGAGKPEFLARTSSGVDRDRRGDLVVPFPWQADEPGAENTTDMTARFRQYDRWDAQRGQYGRGTPEWNSLTTAMNQLQTSTAPWYFAFTPRFGLREEAMAIAGNRSGQDRVQAVANWIRQKQGQGIDPFNQADPYTAAYKAQAAQAASRQVAPASVEQPSQRRGAGGGYLLEASESEGIGPVDLGPSPTGPGTSPGTRPGQGAYGELVWDRAVGNWVPLAEAVDPDFTYTTAANIRQAAGRVAGQVPGTLGRFGDTTKRVAAGLLGIEPGPEVAPAPATNYPLAYVETEPTKIATIDVLSPQLKASAAAQNDARMIAIVNQHTGQNFTLNESPAIRNRLTMQSGSSVGGGMIPPYQPLQPWLSFLKGYGGR